MKPWTVVYIIISLYNSKYACFVCRFEMWSVGFVLTRMITLTLMFLAVGFGLARSENQMLDLETGNFNTLSIR